MRAIFILIPALKPAGPIKGAIALANALAEERTVTLVTLKPGPGADTPIDPRVSYVSLADIPGGWQKRVRAYRRLLASAGGRANTASISMCFSADMVNRFCRREAVICSSVRGNLLINYKIDYGLPGMPLAIGHLFALGEFDHIVAMTSAMAEQVGFYARKLPKVIGNFVDEKALEPFRDISPRIGPMRFVFLASLSPRKCPLLILQALLALQNDGIDVHLDMIGDGVLREGFEAEVKRLGLGDVVTLHGHLASPYEILSRADVFVLPSLSEGQSRAALEALFLGVPCVLRAADGNSELVRQEKNVVLFERDDELARIMLETARWSRQMQGVRKNLLPEGCSQDFAAMRYLSLVENEA